MDLRVLRIPGHVRSDVSRLLLIEHPPLISRMTWVLRAQVVANDLPGPSLIFVTELARELCGFISSHGRSVNECRPPLLAMQRDSCGHRPSDAALSALAGTL